RWLPRRWLSSASSGEPPIAGRNRGPASAVQRSTLHRVRDMFRRSAAAKTALPRHMRGARGPSSSGWIALACLLALFGPAAADDKGVCNPVVIGTAPVRTVLDGRTLLLADGREARLAGIEIGQPDAARAALEAAIAGRDVRLMRLGPETDRYGRISGL